MLFWVFFSYADLSMAVQTRRNAATDLSVAEQTQRDSVADLVISNIKQNSSAEEYGKRLYEKAFYYMKDKERFERNVLMVIELLQESGRQNHPPALKSLAYIYENGKGVLKDLTKAVGFYIQAVQLNYAPAMPALAYLYEYGRGVPKDVGRAVELYAQGVQLKYAPAMVSLAYLYKIGKGVPKDVSRAIELYIQAIQLNYAPAIPALAYLYEHEKSIPQSVWKKKSIELLKQAVKEGSSVSFSKSAALAYIYAYGIGLSVDYTEAKVWIDLVMEHYVLGLASKHWTELLNLRTSIYSHLQLNFDEDPKMMPIKQYVHKFLKGPLKVEALRIIEGRERQNCQGAMSRRY